LLPSAFWPEAASESSQEDELSNLLLTLVRSTNEPALMYLAVCVLPSSSASGALPDSSAVSSLVV
jgi:hypothetical protein